jgi:Flp pilus assembly protein TadG
MVEMALIVPILGLLVFGIIVFGLLLALRQNLAQAAAEGARAGAVAASSSAAQTDAKSAVDRAASSFNQACGNGKLTCGNGSLSTPFTVAPCTNNPAVSCITVQLSLITSGQVIPNIPIVSLFLPSTISATSVAEVS